MTAASSRPQEGEKRSREKERKDAPPCKVVVRRLPPTMSEAQFLEQVAPVPEHDYFRYVVADWSLGLDAFCRAYINFARHDDIYIFQERFDGYVFVDSKGGEFEAVVEFAPHQKVCSGGGGRRKDPKLATLDQDPDYMRFLASLEEEVAATGATVAANLEEIEERERSRGVVEPTPLLQFFKENKEEKLKKREEFKAGRRKKEEERKKQKDEERMRKREVKEKEIRESEKRVY